MSRPTGNLVSDFSIALTGGAQSLIPQNMSRQFLFIHNPSTTNSLAVNIIGGTPALNAFGSATLAPGGYLLFDSFVPTNAVTVIGTSGQGVTCYA